MGVGREWEQESHSRTPLVGIKAVNYKYANNVLDTFWQGNRHVWLRKRYMQLHHNGFIGPSHDQLEHSLSLLRYTVTCSGVTVRAAMLRSRDQTCQETVVPCWCRRLKALSHRQHSSSTSALRNSTGWTQSQRRLVTSTLMDQSRSLRLFHS